MVKVEIENVEQWRDRHGKNRIYYRVRSIGGKRTALRGPVGSTKFWEDYNEAAGMPQEKRVEKNTIQWLIQQYYDSSAFKGMSPRSRRVRKNILTKFCDKNGDNRFTNLLPRHLRKIRDKLTDVPESANSLLKALRQVFKYALEYDHLEINPTIGVAFLKPKNKDGFHAWTLLEVKAYENTHPVGTMARLALALLLYTGQRRSDIVVMGEQHVRDGWMRVKQEKTGKEIQIPILSELRKIIDVTDTGGMTYILTSFGKPFTSNGFGNRVRKWCDEAGLPQCSAHGLRKASGYRMAEDGCSTKEIAAILGHETLKEVERYTKAADQKVLAGNARDRIENKVAQTFEECAQTSEISK
jgi:integrase